MSIFDYNPFTGQLDKTGAGSVGPPGPPGPIGPPGVPGEDGKAASIVFIKSGNVFNNSFLSLQQASNFPSNESPFMVPFDVEVTSISFVNEKNGIDVDLELRVNGTIEFTWNITNARRAIKTNGLSGLGIVAGDALSLSAVNVSATKPRDVIVHVNLAYTSSALQEIISATL